MDIVKGEVVSHSVWTPELEPIEYAPIVRCKDCISFRTDEEGITYCAPMGLEMQPNDFCSYGERKTG